MKNNLQKKYKKKIQKKFIFAKNKNKFFTLEKT
jgi:hypothetical protein